ncbi:efflux RND transporter periplasmic adaptor subunit [Clostridium estertheticum]|uniref:HlyD family secretion protein n=1 Tax=Clostridium estertheticum TaxID=238834 RepID=UPI001C0E885F|nr:efflux RND transporter periplasmic adaptor subunit [Clostridium estertheticum]MBU3177555.1 efflux RND transporter periplasmic adaptor subunit [Clostridium estertheticum]
MKGKFKVLLAAGLVLILVLGGSIGAYFWYNYTHYMSTDNVQLVADFIKVTPLASGKLLEFNVKEGDSVVKDQILGIIDAGADSGAASNIRAPISGVVASKTALVGEYESSASSPTLALIMDPRKIYLLANIDETKISKVKIGQVVDISIDQFKGKKFTGKVSSISQASNNAFSILPAQTSGTFTKVVERVQIKIRINNPDTKLLPGTNAIVKIHIK